MKLTIEKQILVSALAQLRQIVPKSSPLPILKSILFRALPDGRVQLTGTDLDVYVSITIPALREGEPCSLCLPASQLSSMIPLLPDGPVQIEIPEGIYQAKICSGGVTLWCDGLHAEEFPHPGKVDADNTGIRLDQQVLKSLLLLTQNAVSRDETRYVLNGHLVEFKSNVCRVVATDSRRLALIEHEMELAAADELRFILRTDAARALVSLLGDTGTVQILTSKTQAAFLIGDTAEVICKHIDGDYPDYTKVIPDDATIRVQFEREPLVAALQRAVAVLSQNPQRSGAQLDFTPAALDLSAGTLDGMRVSQSVPCSLEGPPLKRSFNAQFLLDGIAKLVADNVTFHLSEKEEDPAVIRSGTFLYVVMPMRGGL